MRKLLPLLLVYSLLFLLPNSSSPTFADTSCTTSGDSPIVTGLTTAPTLGQNLVTTSGACIVNDPKAAFAPYKIPTYEDLKSLYFDQSKSTRKSTYTGNATQGNITSLIQSTDADRLIYVTGSVTITGSGFLNSKPVVPVIIFIDDDLTINDNITFANNSPNGGLVFVVSDNVNIDQSVTSIDAIIIAGGTIYTAGADCTNSSVNTSALTINGSLVSLTESSPAKFCRTLADNTNPAEVINHQVKYLVILRDLMSDTFQRWSEIP